MKKQKMAVSFHIGTPILKGPERAFPPDEAFPPKLFKGQNSRLEAYVWGLIQEMAQFFSAEERKNAFNQIRQQYNWDNFHVDLDNKDIKEAIRSVVERDVVKYCAKLARDDKEKDEPEPKSPTTETKCDFEWIREKYEKLMWWWVHHGEEVGTISIDDFPREEQEDIVNEVWKELFDALQTGEFEPEHNYKIKKWLFTTYKRKVVHLIKDITFQRKERTWDHLRHSRRNKKGGRRISGRSTGVSFPKYYNNGYAEWRDGFLEGLSGANIIKEMKGIGDLREKDRNVRKTFYAYSLYEYGQNFEEKFEEKNIRDKLCGVSAKWEKLRDSKPILQLKYMMDLDLDEIERIPFDLSYNQIRGIIDTLKWGEKNRLMKSANKYGCKVYAAPNRYYFPVKVRDKQTEERDISIDGLVFVRGKLHRRTQRGKRTGSISRINRTIVVYTKLCELLNDIKRATLAMMLNAFKEDVEVPGKMLWAIPLGSKEAKLTNLIARDNNHDILRTIVLLLKSGIPGYEDLSSLCHRTAKKFNVIWKRETVDEYLARGGTILNATDSKDFLAYLRNEHIDPKMFEKTPTGVWKKHITLVNREIKKDIAKLRIDTPFHIFLYQCKYKVPARFKKLSFQDEITSSPTRISTRPEWLDSHGTWITQGCQVIKSKKSRQRNIPAIWFFRPSTNRAMMVRHRAYKGLIFYPAPMPEAIAHKKLNSRENPNLLENDLDAIVAKLAKNKGLGKWHDWRKRATFFEIKKENYIF